ncbi:MAG: hypothetical protein AB8G05_20920 [Oligoflexales bacterium]
MKQYKYLMISFLFFTNHLALANHKLSLYCKQVPGKTCNSRIEQALTKVGCELEEDSVQCQDSQGAGDKIKCKVADVNNCQEPSAYLFSMTANGTYCPNGEKKSLRWYDRKVSLTWSMGLIRGYVKHICVSR